MFVCILSQFRDFVCLVAANLFQKEGATYTSTKPFMNSLPSTSNCKLIKHHIIQKFILILTKTFPIKRNNVKQTNPKEVTALKEQELMHCVCCIEGTCLMKKCVLYRYFVAEGMMFVMWITLLVWVAADKEIWIITPSKTLGIRYSYRTR